MNVAFRRAEYALTETSNRFYTVCQWLANVVLLTFGGWQVLASSMYLAEYTFEQVVAVARWFFILVAIVAVVLPFLQPGRPPVYEKASAPKHATSSRWYWVLAGWLAAVLLFWVTKSYTLLWFLGLGVMAATYFLLKGEYAVDREGQRFLPWKLDWLVVLGLAALSAFIALTIQTSDGDVGLSLSIPVSLMDFPDLPILSFDGMHRELDAPLLSPIYIVQSHEVLVGVISALTGIPVGAVYYLLLPAVFAFLIPIIHWLALRELFGREAIFGLCVAMAALLLWGNGGHSYGSYTYNYMFLSKATISVLWSPFLILLSLRFIEAPSLYRWCKLFLCQAAVIGVSSSALVLAPLLVGIVFLSQLRLEKSSLLTTAIGMATTSYPVFLGLAMYIGDVGHQVLSEEEAGNTAQGLRMLFGEGPRLYLALFAFLAAAVIPGESREWRIRFGLIGMLLFIASNPFVGQLLTDFIAFNLFWRIFWIVPMPLLIGAAAVAALRIVPALQPPYSGIAIGLVFLVAFAATGNWAVTPNKLGHIGYKVVQPNYDAAAQVVKLTEPLDLAIVPEHVAVNIPSIHGSPRLLVVREHYLTHWEAGRLDQHELEAKLYLVKVVNERLDEIAFSPQTTLSHLQALGVNVILLEQQNSATAALHPVLESAGYTGLGMQPFVLYRK